MYIGDDLYKLKIAALLHDPPHKPWLIRERKLHEEEARKLAEEVLGEEILKYLNDPRVKLADICASGFDRWVLSILVGDKYMHKLFPTAQIELKNIVEPLLTTPTPLPEKLNKQILDDFIKELCKIIDKASSWRLRYHLLYLLYETLWINKGLAVGPADTRVPTHTIFDHDYAAASMINWTYCGQGIKGLLIGLDVAGVQIFISSSRKLRDMWVSSYLVSALTWYTIIELVEKLGPDVAITPSLRMNPFYLHWLKTKVNISIPSGIEKLHYLTNEVYEMYRELSIPPYPIIPGRATIVLPPWGQVREILGVHHSDCREYFQKRFKEGWRLLWRIARRVAEKYANRITNTNTGNKREAFWSLVWRFVHKVFNYYEKSLFKSVGFDVNPPLKLRVEYVEAFKDTSKDYSWRIYDEKYYELTSKLELAKYSYSDPEVELDLYNLTKRAFDGGIGLGFPKPSDKGFDYCTMCGKLPAIVVLPARDSEEPCEDEFGFTMFHVIEKDLDPKEVRRIWRLREEVERKRFENMLNEFKDALNKGFRDALTVFKEMFSPGEKLCPWCFLKRVISLEPRILDALLREIEEDYIDEFVKEVTETARPELRFPSLAHIASARLYEKMLDKVEKSVNMIREIRLDKHLPYRLTLELRINWIWNFLKKIQQRLRNIKIDSDEDKYLLYTMYSIDPEEMWFHERRRENWNELLGKYNLAKWLWRYYGLVKADGDSIGDLLGGRIEALLTGRISKYFYIDTKLSKVSDEDKERVQDLLIRYLVYSSSCRSELHNFMRFCIEYIKRFNESLERIKTQYIWKIARECNISVDIVESRVDKALQILRELLDKEMRIIVSPSYHVAISSALMRIALLDIAIIAKLDGFTVYAGGDDLLAFVPVDNVLDVVYNTRRAYGGLSIQVDLGKNIRVTGGFLKLNNAYLPLLPSIGRSYCIYIAHYHYPLSLILERTANLLDEAKESHVLCYYAEGDIMRSAKDVVLIAYNPRASAEEYAMLPLSWRRPIVSKGECHDVASIVESVKTLLGYVDERFSETTKVSRENIKISHSILYDFREPSVENSIWELTCCLIRGVYRDDVINVLKNTISNMIWRNIKQPRKEDVKEKILNEVFGDLIQENEPIGIGYFAKIIGHEAEDACRVICKDEWIHVKEASKIHGVILDLIGMIKLIRSGMR